MEWYYVWWPWLTAKRRAGLSASADLLVMCRWSSCVCHISDSGGDCANTIIQKPLTDIDEIDSVGNLCDIEFWYSSGLWFGLRIRKTMDLGQISESVGEISQEIVDGFRWNAEDGEMLGRGRHKMTGIDVHHNLDTGYGLMQIGGWVDRCCCGLLMPWRRYALHCTNCLPIDS